MDEYLTADGGAVEPQAAAVEPVADTFDAAADFGAPPAVPVSNGFEADGFDAAPAADDFGAAPAADDFGAAPAADDFGAGPAADDFGAAPITDDFGAAPAADDFGGAPAADATVDYYTSEAVTMMPDMPMPGYFAPDGAYVPPTGKEDDNFVVDTSKLDVWEAEHMTKMQEVDASELATISEREASAKAEREQFESERAKRIAQTKENNQAEEAQFIATRDTPVTETNVWERVTQLVDVSSKTGSAEKSRFRSLLLQLKHEPM